jgi:predicted restriction endonuclease
MNSTKILELFLDGAYHQDDKFYHHSFRKGYRAIKYHNISMLSAISKLDKLNQHSYESGITKAIIK